MGLIAREIEGQGIPTLCLSSALSITRSVNPPRTLFVDFPLGHTAGKPHDAALQDGIMAAALSAFESMETPGSLARFPVPWSENDDWKDSVMRPQPDAAKQGEHRDDRAPRSREPQYQCEADRVAAEGMRS